MKKILIDKKNIELPAADELEISGALISSTIKQMASLGSVGESVLERHGIKRVGLKKDIPTICEILYGMRCTIVTDLMHFL